MKSVAFNEEQLQQLLDSVRQKYDPQLYALLSELIRTNRELAKRSAFNFIPVTDLDPRFSPTLKPEAGLPTQFDTRNKSGYYWSEYEKAGDWRHFVLDPSCCRLTRTAAKAIPTGLVTPTLIDFNDERYDTDFMHDVTLLNHLIVINTPGVYCVGACVEWASNAVGVRMLGIRFSSGNFIVRTHVPAIGGTVMSQNVHCEYQFNRGDSIEVAVLQDSGANLDIVKSNNYSPEFWAARVR